MHSYYRLRVILAIVLPVLLLSVGSPTQTRAAPAASRIFLPLVTDNDSGATTATPAPIAPATVGSQQPTWADEVLRLTNTERAHVGCPALRIQGQLAMAAQRQSDDMALHTFVSHTGSDGSSPWDRIQATGYQFRTAAENVAAGYATPAAVVDGWMHSPGHRANILNCDLHELGVGYVTTTNGTSYWTQAFATPR